MLEPLRDIRLLDVVDILLVTSLVYTAFAWLRRTQAALVAFGIVILGAIYIVARALDLRLMTWIFQGFFAIFLVIIVVIFQEELRQLFEWLAVWSLRRRGTAPPPGGPTDTLVRCAADFARDHIGALIVLPGKQPIERHIQGGIELHGRLSEPLLKSLFDPHSPGHDGAVIVVNDCVVKFAAHLPLSKDFRQLSGVGTRHSAALGLAELTDALCLVVSEERGQISVARDGRLRGIGELHELGLELQRFFREKHAPERPRRPAWQLLRENWSGKLASLAIVALLWYLFVPGSRLAGMTYPIPVSVINLPSELVLENVDPPVVKGTFTGQRRAFYLFDPRRLEVVIDASLAQLGRRTFEISEANVRYPKELSLESITPSRVRISVRKNTEESGEKTGSSAERKKPSSS